MAWYHTSYVKGDVLVETDGMPDVLIPQGAEVDMQDEYTTACDALVALGKLRAGKRYHYEADRG